MRAMRRIRNEPVNDATFPGVSIVNDGLLIDLRRCHVDFTNVGWVLITRKPTDERASRRPVDVNPFTGEIVK